MGKLMVRISDDTGLQRSFVIIQKGLIENGVEYVIAIVSPEDPGTDPDRYIAVGYDDTSDVKDNYFFLPEDVSARLVQKFRAFGAVFPEIAEA